MRSPTPADRFPYRAWPLLLIVTAILLAHFGWRIHVSGMRYLNPDELQHLHSAWSIKSGLVPYRDYFEHHTPWLHYSLSLLFPVFDVDRDPDSAVAFIRLARRLMLLLTVGIFVATFWLTRMLEGWRAGVCAASLLAGAVMFYVKTIEIRPDVPASLLLTVSLALVVDALGRREGSRSWRFGLGGAALSAAVLFTQKALFALPGFAITLGIYLLGVGSSVEPATRRRHALWALVGFALPVAATLGYFASQRALGDFVEYNLFFNARFKHGFPPERLLVQLQSQNPFLVTFAVLGFLTESLRVIFRRPFELGRVSLLATALSLFLGLFILPVPHRQYAVLFLPFAAALGGVFVVRALDGLSDWLARSDRMSPFPWRGTLLAFFTGVVSWQMLETATERYPEMLAGRWWWAAAGAGAAAAILLLRHFRSAAISVLLILIGVYPIQHMRYQGNFDEQVRGIRWVLENTLPADPVFDGFSGFGVFRPHAYFFYVLHEEIYAMLTAKDHARLLRELEAGTVAPRLVVYDQDVRRLSKGVRSFIEDNYEPTDVSPIWKLKDLWLDPETGGDAIDLGEGPTDTLAGPGWHPPERVDGKSVRLSRGRRSWLRVPLKRPTGLRVSVHGRSEVGETAVRLELAVNGERVRKVTLTPGWQDYRFRVPRRFTRRGINRFLFTYSTTPGRSSANGSGKNAVIAVDHVRLRATRQ